MAPGVTLSISLLRSHSNEANAGISTPWALKNACSRSLAERRYGVTMKALRIPSAASASATALDVVSAGTPTASSMRRASSRSQPKPLRKLPLVQQNMISSAPRSARGRARSGAWSHILSRLSSFAGLLEAD